MNEPSDIEQLETYLKLAFNIAAKIANERGNENAVGRAVISYTIPNLRHWIDGAQAGNIKHLRELLAQEKNG